MIFSSRRRNYVGRRRGWDNEDISVLVLVRFDEHDVTGRKGKVTPLPRRGLYISLSVAVEIEQAKQRSIRGLCVSGRDKSPVVSHYS